MKRVEGGQALEGIGDQGIAFEPRKGWHPQLTQGRSRYMNPGLEEVAHLGM
jgi:hypothetical protein